MSKFSFFIFAIYSTISFTAKGLFLFSPKFGGVKYGQSVSTKILFKGIFLIIFSKSIPLVFLKIIPLKPR
ncbi:hypothetical protein AMJ49_03780 [Parcubacteria bacterium DG_74_2]|nr:MAG: hypothetical protein AMJ49_03780 [Parcubacteria bacterium DG_74_2]